MSDIRNASKVGRLTFLSDEKKRDIYLAALEICATIGMRVYHVEVERMLMEAGCTKTADERVLMPRHLIEQARLSVPACVNVYDRDGVLALELGGYNSYFGTGSDLMSTYDLETKEHRPSTLDDVRRAARLCDALPAHGLRHELRPPEGGGPSPLLPPLVPGHDGIDPETLGHDGRERRRPRRS